MDLPGSVRPPQLHQHPPAVRVSVCNLYLGLKVKHTNVTTATKSSTLQATNFHEVLGSHTTIACGPAEMNTFAVPLPTLQYFQPAECQRPRFLEHYFS